LEADFVLVTDAYEDDFTDIVSQPFMLTIFVNGRKRQVVDFRLSILPP
jgi:hypothetical protein